ncbi:MAG TPA: glycosyltransferase [Pirellulales bacterium]|nr:glycosyltransferase [Pirellulales bacterium]
MPRLILIDPSLVGFSGHHFEFARRVLSAARHEGFTSIVAAHRTCAATADELGAKVDRVFEYGLWSGDVEPACCRRFRQRLQPAADHRTADLGVSANRSSRAMGRLSEFGRRCADAIRRRRFTGDLVCWSRTVGVTDDDVVFVPTATSAEWHGCMALLGREPRWRNARWNLLFRRDAIGPDGRPTADARRLARSAWVFTEACRGGRVACWTDTNELADQYDSLGPLRFGTLPIPVGDGFRPQSTDPAKKPLRIVFLGDARAEKGFQHLPRLLDQVWDDLVVPGRAQFVLQACPPRRTEPQVEPVLAELARRPRPQVTLLHGPLTSAEYQRQLTQADVVLVPYEPRAYVARSSGILAEALAAGIPAIVPDGTWMAEQIAAPNGGQAGAIFRRPDEIGLALREVIKDYPRFRQSALALSRRWADHHSPIRLVRQLAQGSTGDPPARVRWAA